MYNSGGMKPNERITMKKSKREFIEAVAPGFIALSLVVLLWAGVYGGLFMAACIVVEWIFY